MSGSNPDEQVNSNPVAEVVTNHHESRGGSSWTQRLRIGICCGVALATLYENASPAPVQEQVAWSIDVMFPDRPIPKNKIVEIAPPVPHDAEMKVRFLISQPSSKKIEADKIKSRSQEIKAKYPDMTDRAIEGMVQYQVRQEIADFYELTVFDPTATIQALSQDLAKPSDKQMPIEDYLATANNFFGNYDGAEITTEVQSEYDYNLGPVSEPLLSSQSSREILLKHVEELAKHPLEMIRLNGFKQLVLAEQKKGEPNAGGYVIPNGSGKVVANMSAPTVNVVPHELGHLTDLAISGGYEAMQNDPGFNAVSGITKDKGEAWTDYKQPANLASGQPITLPQFAEYRKEVTSQVSEAARDHDPNCKTLAEQAENSLAKIGRMVTFLESYSSATILEAKANIYGTLPDNTHQLIDTHTPKLNNQLVHLLAGIYQYNPRVVMFYLDMSYRPERATSLVDLCQ